MGSWGRGTTKFDVCDVSAYINVYRLMHDGLVR
jgi:hypothetical protein